jgi:hypothetical protein
VMTTEMGERTHSSSSAASALYDLQPPPDINASAPVQVEGEKHPPDLRHQGCPRRGRAYRGARRGVRSLQSSAWAAAEDRASVEALIKAGAFDAFGPNCPVSSVPLGADGAEQAAAAPASPEDMFGKRRRPWPSGSVPNWDGLGWKLRRNAKARAHLAGHPSTSTALTSRSSPRPASRIAGGRRRGEYRGPAAKWCIRGLIRAQAGTRTSIELDDGTGTLRWVLQGIRLLSPPPACFAIADPAFRGNPTAGAQREGRLTLTDRGVSPRAAAPAGAPTGPLLSPSSESGWSGTARPCVSLYYSTGGTRARVALGRGGACGPRGIARTSEPVGRWLPVRLRRSAPVVRFSHGSEISGLRTADRRA